MPYDRHVALVGEYIDGRFHVQGHNILDHGRSFYASQAFRDETNRRVLFAWLRGARNEFVVFVDHSVVEVFTDDGTSLTARVYPKQEGLFRFTLRTETAACLDLVRAWEMESTWSN